MKQSKLPQHFARRQDGGASSEGGKKDSMVNCQPQKSYSNIKRSKGQTSWQGTVCKGKKEY